jgi:hypothetical protein
MNRRGEGSIRQRPSGSWEARYRDVDGLQRSIVARDRNEVARRLRNAPRERDQGIRPLDYRLTTGAYLEDWLEHHARPKVRQSTLDSYAAVIRLYLIPELGRIPLAQLQPEHVRRMLGSIASRGRRGTLSPTWRWTRPP